MTVTPRDDLDSLTVKDLVDGVSSWTESRKTDEPFKMDRLFNGDGLFKVDGPFNGDGLFKVDGPDKDHPRDLSNLQGT